jgi:hypothetical protein
MSLPGGASLDGEPPASASATIRPAGLEVGAPSTHAIQTLRGPGGASIDCSSAPSLPVAAFSTADRACDVASDALSRDPPRTWPRDRIPFAWGRSIHLHRRLVKDDDFAGSGRLPSTSSPSPCASGFRRRRVGSRGACHRSRCSRARGSRHCDPASGAASPAEPPGGRARELDPWSLDQDPAPLIDFCNPNNPRARPRDRPIPPCAQVRPGSKPPDHGAASGPFPERALARSARPGSSRSRGADTVRWPSPRPRRLHVDPRLRGTSARACALASVTPGIGLAASVRRWASTSWLRTSRFRLEAEPRPCGLGLTGAVTIASRGFTGQGPTGVHRRRLSLRESFTPTRSARTPPVARSMLHRLETPMSPAMPCQKPGEASAFHDHATRPGPPRRVGFVCPR